MAGAFRQQSLTHTRAGNASGLLTALGDWDVGAVGSPTWLPSGTTVASQQGSAATYIYGRLGDAGVAGTDTAAGQQ